MQTESSNALIRAGGGSAVPGAPKVRFTTPVTLTVQGLTAGSIYTLRLYNVGEDLLVPSFGITKFSFGSTGLAVDQVSYGNENGIRVDSTFRAAGPTQGISIQPGFFWGLPTYALALRRHTGHTAYVFRTDTAPMPREQEAAIFAHGGPGTAILTFGPGEGGTLNGVPVYDQGAVTLPRFDFTLGVPQGLDPRARHFLIAGNLNLDYQTSLWGVGGLLLKLEVANNANLQPGSSISVATQGRIGGAGGGWGGVPSPHPVLVDDYRVNSFLTQGKGGLGSGDGNGQPGTDGNPVMSYNKENLMEPGVLAAAIGGGAGTIGQGMTFSRSGRCQVMCRWCRCDSRFPPEEPARLTPMAIREGAWAELAGDPVSVHQSHRMGSMAAMANPAAMRRTAATGATVVS